MKIKRKRGKQLIEMELNEQTRAGLEGLELEIMSDINRVSGGNHPQKGRLIAMLNRELAAVRASLHFKPENTTGCFMLAAKTLLLPDVYQQIVELSRHYAGETECSRSPM
jgi:hypothetical protein